MYALRLLRAVAIVTLTATLASGVQAADDTEASVSEYITLPKFCWYQFSGGTVQGSTKEFEMSHCGPHMNHYCYGLLDLQRSRKAKNAGERRVLLGRAKTHTVYTINGMKQDGTFGTCSITPHVQATMQDIELQMRIYNVK